ncbi:MAG: hypothetical protein M3N53_04670 [Actinomycetota bacterium]|nr:hypothetical protein [Actinomycetota bacterium]
MGFTAIEVVHRTPWTVDDCAIYPLFTPELISLMRRLLPASQEGRVGDSIVVKARRGG